MKGLELCKQYYLEYGKDMLDTQFAEQKDSIAVGLVGEGSECLGYDDLISRDHDFSVGFCMFVSRKDYEKFGFKLERAYAKLPKTYNGISKAILSPVGGNRTGVVIMEDFYLRHLGVENIPDSLEWWLSVPSTALLNASNGEVFVDNSGNFSQNRNILKAGYPEDVRLKKLASHVIFMAQAGQYNYPRCVERGETGAAQLAIFEFVKHAISTVYLLNNRYEPFYKWAYKGMRDLAILGHIEELLVGLTEIDNGGSYAATKMEIIEDITKLFVAEFYNQNITEATCLNLETHAYSIQDHIKDNTLRNMHIMDGM